MLHNLLSKYSYFAPDSSKPWTRKNHNNAIAILSAFFDDMRFFGAARLYDGGFFLSSYVGDREDDDDGVAREELKVSREIRRKLVMGADGQVDE